MTGEDEDRILVCFDNQDTAKLVQVMRLDRSAGVLDQGLRIHLPCNIRNYLGRIHGVLVLRVLR